MFLVCAGVQALQHYHLAPKLLFGHALAKFTAGLKTIPAGVTWYLADIAEAKGKQVLKDLKKQGKVVSEGRGLGARWRRKGNTLL